ncbi:MAG TPA: response regulator transcription factor, partial [Streptomyces sp.]|nr:response regulator transcription factor [Streptomyces sp.]
MTVRILLCDDHAVVRAGLRALLSSAPDIEVAGEAATGEEAIALTRRLRPDVVLMDLQLGEGMDGVETTRRILAAEEPDGGTGTTPHILVLTTYDTDADITRAIEAGATGYLLKAERPEELFAAIQAAAEGRTALSPPVASRVMSQLRTPRPTLTPRERDILGHLVQGL